MAVTASCRQCGEPVTPGARHCTRCGKDVTGEQGNLATEMVRPAGGLGSQEAAELEALRQATLGEYDIMGVLGRGGMATVYLAHEIALDRKVAVKVMSPALLSGEGMVERFKREARTAAALSHPNIIQIFSVKDSPPVVYFVMKFIEGRSLDSIIREVGPLPLGMVRAILDQVASALEYAHSRGVVHRDMKPANIMIDTDGRAIVTDFGIAKAGQGKGLTMTGAAIGTPYYMSPEQCAAKKELTGASDQYSLGIVAHEMLTGKVPFNADSPLSIMYAHFHEPPPPVTEGRPDCPPEIQLALQRMLAKDPAERWPDVESAVTALGAAPLARTDPVLAQMKTLARSGVNAALAQTVRTPASPVPGSLAASVPRPKAPARTVALPPTMPSTRESAGEPRARRMLWAVPVIAFAAAGGWWLATRAADRKVEQPKEPTVAQREPKPKAPEREVVVKHDTVRVPVPVPAPSSAPATEPAATPAPPAVPASPPAVTEAQFRAMGIQALSRRSKATAVGATMADLRAGDVEAVQAEFLGKQGKYTEGAAHLEAAMQAWTAAADVAASTPRATPIKPNGRAQRRASAGENANAEIESVIAAYASALETRDLAKVRHAYPGLTPEQSQNLGAFFQRAKDLRVRLTVANVVRTGDRADAMISGSYEYLDLETGRLEQQTVSRRAGLQYAFGSWKLRSIQ